MTDVHVVVPEGVDDPDRPSGGNAYDRRLCQGLADLGWSVHEHPAAGAWPRADARARSELAATLAEIRGGTVVVLDGLVASAVPEVLVPEAGRLRLVVLVHMPLGQGMQDADAADLRRRERAALSAAAAVVTTSRWTRGRLLERYGLPPSRVLVAPPGVDRADLARGSATGGRLLCVGAVTPTKGHDLLVDALARVEDAGWRCTCVGSVDLDPSFVDRVRGRARSAGLGDRVRFTGPRAGGHLDAAYGSSDVLVTASRAETYGMVVTEALARGLPVVATRVGGVPEALGRAPGGRRPGLLVPARDPAALAGALNRWLGDAALREDLRRAARERRPALAGWPATSRRVSGFLAEVAA